MAEREYHLRLVYNSIQIEIFSRSVEVVDPCAHEVIDYAEALSLATAIQIYRFENEVSLTWNSLAPEDFNKLYTYYVDWGRFGKQCALTLDAFNRDVNTWEYDNFNTHFDKAELMNPFDFHPRRSIYEWNRRYDLTLAWRQGA